MCRRVVEGGHWLGGDQGFSTLARLLHLSLATGTEAGRSDNDDIVITAYQIACCTLALLEQLMIF